LPVIQVYPYDRKKRNAFTASWPIDIEYVLGFVIKVEEVFDRNETDVWAKEESVQL
jgi:hypothetical protein